MCEGWWVMECVDAAAMLEYRLAPGLDQYEPGEGKMLAVEEMRDALEKELP